MGPLSISRPNLSSILTTCALVTALAAGPVAAATVVRSVDIVDGEVKTVDLAKGAVTNKKFAANAVNGAVVNEGTLGIVPNTDQLDRRDSASFVAGPGRIVAGRTSVSRGAIAAIFSSAIGAEIGFNVAYQCPGGSPSVPGMIQFRNRTGTPTEVWYQDGGDDPVFVQVAANGTTDFAANEQSHSVKLRITQWPSNKQATVIYSLTGLATSCKTNGLAILAN